MADDKDLDAWDESLEDNNAPDIGANKEMIRKAMMLNPSLRDAAMTSTDLLNKLTEAKKGVAPAANKPPAPAAPRSLTEVVKELRQALDDKKKAIAAARAQLDKEERELKPVLCDRFIDAVLAVDPNMTSPKTAFVMQQDKAFLDGIGFSTQKLVERESKKR